MNVIHVCKIHTEWLRKRNSISGSAVQRRQKNTRFLVQFQSPLFQIRLKLTKSEVSEEVGQAVHMWSDRSGQILKPGWKRSLRVYRDKTDRNLKKCSLLSWLDLYWFTSLFHQIHQFQLNFIETDYFSFLLQIYFHLRSPSIDQWLENLSAAVPLTDAH